MTFFDLEQVDHFIVGAVGMPGDRTFFFQVFAGKTLVSFKAEKSQIAALAGHLERMLADLPGSAFAAGAWGKLDLPVFPEWDVGAIGLGYERESDTVVIVLNELERVQFGPEPLEEGIVGRARFRLTRPQAVALATHGRQLVSAGRPTCEFCATPIDTDGYNCACFN